MAKKSKAPSESSLLSHIFASTRGMEDAFPRVLAGPGHDCAVVSAPSQELLLKVDQVLEGKHFRKGTPLKLIAHKAVARAISDIAASGGSPWCALVAAAVPRGFKDAASLFDLVLEAGEGFSCPVVGGDISGTSGPLSLSVTIVGHPHPARGPVLRDGAQVGDLVYVTGKLGGSFDTRTGRGRHLTFTPRLAEAKALCDTLGNDLHAMMDLSDGLGRDAGRMARISGVAMELEADALPRHRGVSTWRHAMGDGEDYELLFTVPAARLVEPQICGTEVTCVGQVVQGNGEVWVLDGAKRLECSELGWEH